MPLAEPRRYFFFLAGALALLAAGLGAAFAPAFADDPFAEGLDADPCWAPSRLPSPVPWPHSWPGRLRRRLGRRLGRGLGRGRLRGGGRSGSRRRRRSGRRLHRRTGTAGSQRERSWTLRRRRGCRRGCRRVARRLLDRSLFGGDLGRGRPSLLARRLLGVRVLGLSDELVRLLLGHLAAADHVLHEIARALDGKPGQSSGGADHVLHRRGDLAARLLADQLGPLGHFGDRVAHVGATMAGSAARCSWCCGARLVGRLIVVHHVPGPFPCAGGGAPRFQ